MTTVEKSSERDNIVPFPSSTKMEYHVTIPDLPSNERPRERLQNHGPQALSNTELLAIILRTGTTHSNVLELAGILLAKFGGLGGLMRADFMELCKEYGLGMAKAAQLKAALEIGRRLGMVQPDEKYQIKSPIDAANLVMMEMAFLDHEHSCTHVPVPIPTFDTGDFGSSSSGRLCRSLARWMSLAPFLVGLLIENAQISLTVRSFIQVKDELHSPFAYTKTVFFAH
jgi:hypothetical protein